MIRVEHLTKKYGSTAAVRDLSFTMEFGKVYGFLGANGAGKSTTMNILTGCLAATSGTVRIKGFDIYDDAVAAKKCIGYLPEIPPVYPDMTPEEYLTFVGRAKGLRGAELTQDVERVMETVGITAYRDRLISHLSKGYRQRVGIAQAILGDPPIIILDEPTVGLDPRQIIEIRELIRSLGKDHTVILSSHILPEISAVCDHVLILSHGVLAANDSLESLSAYLTGDAETEITVRGEENDVRMTLNEIPGVLSYEIGTEDSGEVTSAIRSEKGTDIREALFRAFAKENLPLLRLDTRTVTLEDVFLRLTADADEGEMRNGLQWNENLTVTEEEPEENEDDEDEEEEPDGTYHSLFSDPNGGDRS